VSASKENKKMQKFVNVRKRNNRKHDAAKTRNRSGLRLEPVHVKVKGGNTEKRKRSYRSLNPAPH
jgi:hypothetical protein